VRIAFRALAPGRGGLPDGGRRDTERTVIEVEDVGVEAEGRQECGVHEPILPSLGVGAAACRRGRLISCPRAPGATTGASAAPAR
jgi:hypothetical protein